MTVKYNGKDDPHDHLAKWTKLWEHNRSRNGYIFCHTLDTIPMNWYLEIELYHDTVEWDVLKEGFLLTFNFKDRFASIDEALRALEDAIYVT